MRWQQELEVDSATSAQPTVTHSPRGRGALKILLDGVGSESL